MPVACSIGHCNFVSAHFIVACLRTFVQRNDKGRLSYRTGACPECDIVLYRGGPEVLACGKCGSLVHLDCAYLGISKKSVEKHKKAQVDYVCKVFSPLLTTLQAPSGLAELLRKVVSR